MIQYVHAFHVLVVHGLGSYLVLPSLLLWLTVPAGIPVVNGYTFLTRGNARAYHELLQGLRYANESLTHS